LVLWSALLLCGCAGSPATADFDEPEHARESALQFKAANSHERSMLIWKTPEDINAWTAANFSYDKARAIRLSETQRAKQAPLAIYTPSEFFDRKSGVCVDLARFGVETLKQIDPDSKPKYLMIEFEPIQIEENTVRLHWLASFKRNGQLYFFSDSKRPGQIVGPYGDIQTFIEQYQRYRGRAIVAYRELPSFQKQQRARAITKA